MASARDIEWDTQQKRAVIAIRCQLNKLLIKNLLISIFIRPLAGLERMLLPFSAPIQTLRA